MSISSVSIPALLLAVFILIAIIVFLRGLRMPGSFKKQEDARAEIRKRLRTNRDTIEKIEAEVMAEATKAKQETK